MDLLHVAAARMRFLLSGDPAPVDTFCAAQNVTYQHRVDNPDSWNWCLVPDGGYDAVFFAGVAIFVMCLASPRWDALVVLFFGGIYFTFSYYWNLEHVSNAVMLWLGMRPADIFVYVFLPPFLLDLSVRIDFFMLKKVAFNIAFMAFVMVAASALLLIPFMLYALDLKSSGWTAGYVALFGSMIASTDAASVSAVLRSGGGPEILSVLLEGESLFNDASSLTLFEIFKEIVSQNEHNSLAHDIKNIVVMTIWSAFTGICIGLAMGIFTRWIYVWLQYRNMEAMAEVAWSVGGAYLSFYITQVWCHGSGCIGAVAFGLYGSATLLWGMSTKARLAGIFSQFWSVLIFVINGLIFFYVGASSVNFTIRSSKQIFNFPGGGTELMQILVWKLPCVYLASFTLRFILIFVSFKVLQFARLSEGLSIQEVIFVTVGGLRGSLSLVLAQSAATMASTSEENKVKAEIAIYTAGYVIMTLLINAPLCGPLLTLLRLDRVRQEQLAMRGEVKNLFRKFTMTAIEDLAAGQDEDELLQGLDWGMLREKTNFDKQLDKELPEVQPRIQWCRPLCTTYWRLVTAPSRLFRRLAARAAAAKAGDGLLELDAKAEAEIANKQKADLKRATNLNMRELQRNETRAVKVDTAGAGPGAGAPSPSALIIREQYSHGVSSSAGRSHHLSSSTTSHSNSRRAPVGMSTGSLRRSNSRRVSAMVVSAAPGGGVSTAMYSNTGVSDSINDRSYRRGNSRFLEGAVAGPAPVGAGGRAPLSTAGGANGVLSKSSSTAARRLDSIPDAAGNEDDSCIQLMPPPMAAAALSGQRRGEQRGSRLRRASGQGNMAGDGAGGGMVDLELLALSDAQAEATGEQRSSDESKAGGGSLPEVAAVPPPAPPGERAPAEATAAPADSQPLSPSAMAALAVRGSVVGGDSMIEAALAADAAEEAEAAATSTAADNAESDAVLSSAPAQRPPTLKLPSSGSLQQPGSGPARPSPLSRGGTGGSSGPLSRLAASSSMQNLQEAQSGALAGGNTALPAADGGSVSEPELQRSPVPGATAPERGLLQSLLVIKPANNSGRTGGMPTSGTTGLAPSSSVRLVQRLGNDGRGSALETLRTEANTLPGSRTLGRGSVRASSGVGNVQLDVAAPVPEFDPAATSFSVLAADRPLGRSSLSAPNAGRPLGRSSGVLEGPDVRSAGSEPYSISPFEFALPEDAAPAASFADPFQLHKEAAARRGEMGDLGRSSLRAPAGDGGGLGRSSARLPGGDGGGLARASMRGPGAEAPLGRQSIRQSGAGGGGGGGVGQALGRASMRLGRQGGLAAASAQLARIYDADLLAGFGSGGSAAAASPAGDNSPVTRPGGLLDSPGLAHRLSNQQDRALGSPSRSVAGTNQHIMAQVHLIQQREAQGAMSRDSQPPSGREGQHQPYQLGATSKGVLLSLIRRSASHHQTGGPGGGGAQGPVRDMSGRGAESLARRTRFADTTAAALARASASAIVKQPSSADVEGASAGVCAPLLVEYRLRLLAGLKQYYRQKHAAGSLSPSSYKVLSYVADQSAHHPENPLALWSMVKKEVSSGLLLQWEASAYYRLKHWTAAAKTSENSLVRTVVPRLLVPFVWMLSLHTSATSLSALETAVELWASLTQSLQTEWLQYSGLYGELLLEEVQHEADGAWAYIIERRIETPNKFGAVQTHRAVIDVLTQQQAFVREMNEGGMIDESECRKIVEVVEKRLQLLARKGPRWRQPTVMEILAGTAILRGLPPKVVEWIRKNSTMRVYQQGAAIWDMGRRKPGADPDGLIIVVRGVVRMMLEQEGTLMPYYLGAGGVGGLVSCALEDHVPGMSSAAAYAEGNAMGKGPVVMHIPWSVLQVLRRFSREEKLPAYQALDLQLYRTAAVYALDLLRHQITQQFSAFIRSSLLTILSSERLEAPTVRRQRIRLLLQPAASDHHVDGGIDWIGELMEQDLDTARLLLDPTANATERPTLSPAPSAAVVSPPTSPFSADANANGSANAPSGGSASLLAQHATQAATVAQRLAALPWVEAMYKAIAAATGSVLDTIRSSLKDAILVVMSPGQGVVQRTTMVLIQGSLEPAPIEVADGTGGASGAGGPFVATPNECHVAPSVMVWVSDFFEGELVSQKELEVVAGPRGATLLLWGVHPEDLLVPNRKEAAEGKAEAQGGEPEASKVNGEAVTPAPSVEGPAASPVVRKNKLAAQMASAAAAAAAAAARPVAAAAAKAARPVAAAAAAAGGRFQNKTSNVNGQGAAAAMTAEALSPSEGQDVAAAEGEVAEDRAQSSDGRQANGTAPANV